MNQQEYIGDLESRLDEQLTKAIAVFQNLPESQLVSRKKEGEWSIAECLEHLNSYYLYYLPKIENALGKNHDVASGTYKPGYIGTYLIRLMDVRQSKRKFKAIRRHRPATDLQGHAVVQDFIRYSEHLLELIRRSRDVSLTATIPTSLSAWLRMRIGDALLFLLVHNERHLIQAQRNLD